jgi:hypothetical protein
MWFQLEVGGWGCERGDGQRRHRLTKHPIYQLFAMSCSFQTKLMTDVKSMAIVPMHEWKMPLKYWGMLSS